MLLRPTNIEEQLARKRDRAIGEKNILQEVYKVLKDDAEQESSIHKNLKRKESIIENGFDISKLESRKIYHLSQIKEICIEYRLRFLDSKYFKGSIPQAGISEIKELEKKHLTQLKGFKIIAPSRLFKLEDKNDPLLFVPIGNDYYYLIHKWGNDLHPLRKIMAWPFKNLVNLILVVVLISYLITLLIPNGLFSNSQSIAEFWIIFFFMFKSIAAIVLFYGIALGKNFNPAIWNSRYFNA
jgi:hypothetical protein